MASNSFTSVGRRIRSRNIFVRILYDGNCVVRSSRHRAARARERLGPAGAKTAHVTAADLLMLSV